MTFVNFKESTEELFNKLKDHTNNTKEILAKCIKNSILKGKCREDTYNRMQSIAEDLDEHLKKIKRKQMKCVFFGQTSNGKSAMINAILGSEVLPSSDGRTTSCFITINSCDEEPYFMVDGSRENDMRKLMEMADETSEKFKKIKTHIELFWPFDECKLLDENVQLLDSPGVDYSPDNDKWIDTYCRDSDIFVYVVNAQSTINESERKFFRKVTSLLGNPNIFVVWNKWDLCDTERNEHSIDKTRRQHLATAKEFLCNDLKLNCDYEKKTFFLSAKEQLENSSEIIETNSKVSKRMQDFQTFFQTLCFEMQQRAVINKFGPPLEIARKYIGDIEEALNLFRDTMKYDFPKRNKKIHEITNEINVQIKHIFDKIFKEGEEEIKRLSPKLAADLMFGNQMERSEFIREQISQSLRAIFENNIEDLRMKMMELFSSCSEFHLSDEVLNAYTPASFKQHSTKLEKGLAMNIKKGDAKIQDQYANKETELKGEIASKGFVSNVGKSIGTAAYLLMFSYPIAAAVTVAVSSIVSNYSENAVVTKTNEIKEEMRVKVEELMIEHMKISYRECQKEIENGVSGYVKTFYDDHEDARQLIVKINELKIICGNLSEDVILELSKILSIDDNAN